MKKTKEFKIPKGYSIESVRKIDSKLIIFLDKDTKLKNGTVEKIVPIRVIQGL